MCCYYSSLQALYYPFLLWTGYHSNQKLAIAIAKAICESQSFVTKSEARSTDRIGYDHPYRTISYSALGMWIRVNELHSRLTLESELKLALVSPIEIFDDARWLCRYMCANCRGRPRSNQNSNWLWPPLSRYLMMHADYVDACARIARVGHIRIRTQIGYDHLYRDIWWFMLDMSIGVRKL